MNTVSIKIIVIAFSSLFITSIVQAKCYPGLDCPSDLPKSPDSTAPRIPTPTTSSEDWQMVDRYMVKGGLVKDPTTGLMWMRCSFGQTWDGSTCAGQGAKVKWEQAMNIPKHFDYAGYSDWRLPTKNELDSLVYCSDTSDGSGCTGSYSRPTIIQAVFPNISDYWFWTSSSDLDPFDHHTTGLAWVVSFYGSSGSGDSKDSDRLVRLVRSK